MDDDSRITAANGGAAVTTCDWAIIIGDNAVLTGSVYGSGYGAVQTSVVAPSSAPGSIIIGDNATILNDGVDTNLVDAGDTEGQRQGVYAGWGGEIVIGNGASITTRSKGDGAGNHAIVAGDRVYNETGQVTVGDGATIEANGSNTYGLFSTYSGSDITMGKNATIVVNDTGSAGENRGIAAQKGGQASIGDGSSVTVEGDNARGLLTTSDGDSRQTSRTTITTGNGVSLTTTGANSYGARADYTSGIGSTISLGSDNTVDTSGVFSHGLMAYGADALIEAGNNLTVNTTGDEAYGLTTFFGGTISAQGVNITTRGLDSIPVAIIYGGLIEMTGGRLASVGPQSSGAPIGTAILAQGTNSAPANVRANGQFTIIGDVSADDYGQVDMNLTNGSSWQGAALMSDVGAANRVSLAGAGSTWRVTGDSRLTSLVLGGSTVDFRSAPLGTRLEAAALSGQGVFVLKADISQETADRVTVTGSSNGQHKLLVMDQSSGPTHGLEVVDLVDAVDGGTWCDMDRPVDVGAWRYELRRTETGAGGAHVWQLAGRQIVSDTVSSAVNVFSGSYMLLDAENRSLVQRLGDLRHTAGDNGLWARAYGGEFESGAGRHVRNFDLDYRGLQVGFDHQWFGGQPGDRHSLTTGAALGLSRGDLDYGRTGEGRVDGKSLSLYATWLAPHGFYLDLVGRSAWLDNEFDILDTYDRPVRGETVSTHGLGLSVETGRLTPVWQNEGHMVYLEPQIQYSFDRQSGNTFRASNGVRVDVSPFNSERLRTGLRLGYESQGPGRKVNVYAKASYVKEFDGETDFKADGTPLKESFGSNRWLYGAGGSIKISQANAVYFDVERSAGGRIQEPWSVKGGWRWEF